MTENCLLLSPARMLPLRDDTADMTELRRDTLGECAAEDEADSGSECLDDAGGAVASSVLRSMVSEMRGQCECKSEGTTNTNERIA